MSKASKRESGKFKHRSDWQLNSLMSFASVSTEMLRVHRPEEAETIHALADQFGEAARAFYRRGVEIIEALGASGQRPASEPYMRRQLIERIGEEWTRVTSLLSAFQLVPEGDEAVEAVRKVIFAAWSNLQMGRHKVVVLPHFGRHFELVRFRYAPGVTVMGMPMVSLYAPWDWTIIWHEVAGILVQTKAVAQWIDELDAYMREEGIWQDWLEQHAPKLDYLPRDEQDPSIPVADSRHGWLQEFLEDAVGVLCLGDGMISGLRDILDEYYAQDEQQGLMAALIRPGQQDKRAVVEGEEMPDVPLQAPDEDEVSPTVAPLAADVRHPLPYLRIQLALGLAEQMGLEVEEAVEDEGANRLAGVIFQGQDKLVRQAFTTDDATWVEHVAQSLVQSGEMTIVGKEAELPAHVLIPAALRAFTSRETIEGDLDDRIWGMVRGRLADAPAPVEKMFGAQVGAQESRIELSTFDMWQTGLEKLTGWADLLNYTFSDTDQATVMAYSSHSLGDHIGPFGGQKNASVWVLISGLTAHNEPHDGWFEHRHGH